jgi:hypothetical protein
MGKLSGIPMPNPNPKIENLTSFKRVGDRDLGKVIGTRYPLDVQDALLELKDYQGFIRQAVEAALREQGLMNDGDTAA